MIKNLYLALISLFVVGLVFAFSPSQTLKDKISNINEKIESIITKNPSKLDSFKKAIDGMKIKYAKNEKAIYILGEISKKLDLLESSTGTNSIKTNSDSKYFKIEGDKIFFSDDDGITWNEVGINTYQEIINLNPISEKRLDFDSFQELNYGFAKDKNGVYVCGAFCSEGGCLKLDGADKDSFQNLNDFYSKDNDNVYFVGNCGEIIMLTGADSSTFQLINNKYAKDKNFVYGYGKLLTGADINSFEVLSPAISKDKNSVFVLLQKVEGVDISTLEVIDDNSFKDKNYDYTISYDGPMGDEINISKQVRN